MFVYAMARAIRLGWIAPALREAAMRAIDRAWQGLTRISIDKFGNVHGVCRGSLYSFTPEYYKNVLLWNLNDVHGTGIVMLAGIEVLKLLNVMRNEPVEGFELTAKIFEGEDHETGCIDAYRSFARTCYPVWR